MATTTITTITQRKGSQGPQIVYPPTEVVSMSELYDGIAIRDFCHQKSFQQSVDSPGELSEL